MANEGGLAATVSADLKAAKGLKAKWAVIDRWGLREKAVRHMEHCRRTYEATRSE